MRNCSGEWLDRLLHSAKIAHAAAVYALQAIDTSVASVLRVPLLACLRRVPGVLPFSKVAEGTCKRHDLKCGAAADPLSAVYVKTKTERARDSSNAADHQILRVQRLTASVHVRVIHGALPSLQELKGCNQYRHCNSQVSFLIPGPRAVLPSLAVLSDAHMVVTQKAAIVPTLL